MYPCLSPLPFAVEWCLCGSRPAWGGIVPTHPSVAPSEPNSAAPSRLPRSTYGFGAALQIFLQNGAWPWCLHPDFSLPSPSGALRTCLCAQLFLLALQLVAWGCSVPLLLVTALQEVDKAEHPDRELVLQRFRVTSSRSCSTERLFHLDRYSGPQKGGRITCSRGENIGLMKKTLSFLGLTLQSDNPIELGLYR